MTQQTLANDREALSARLMAHIDALCGQFGARPAGSDAEHGSIGYLKGQLHALGLKDLREQSFDVPPAPSLLTGAALLAGLLGIHLGRRGRLGKVAGGGLLLAAAHSLREIMQGRMPTAAQPLALFNAVAPLPERISLLSLGSFALSVRSQNLIARIPAAGRARGTIYLVAHVDSGQQRYLQPHVFSPITRPFNNALLGLGLLGGLSLVAQSITGGRGLPILTRMAGAIGAGTFAGTVYDAVQPTVEGANSNASGVAVALELARQIAADPLPEHDLIIIFTGAAERLNAGIEAFLNQYAPPKAESAWIVLDSVGVGSPIYVQRGGLSAFTDVRPGPQVTAVAVRASRERPELRIAGRPLTTLDESSALRAHGYEALRIAAVDTTGHVPNWNRTDDTTHALNPDTLTRTTEYVRALLAGLDA